MSKSIWILLFLSSNYSLLSAQNIHLHVADASNNEVLIGANIYWGGSTSGTVSDINGEAEIQPPTQFPAQLIVSYVGYKTDTIMVNSFTPHLEIYLQASVSLQEVTITGKKQDQFVSALSTMKTEVITQNELRKAACCNLSESFQTNASVEVNYEDAATGAKEIMLLGLEGVYIQSSVELAPALRGLAATYGLDNIPSPWLQSISVSKGVPSVKSGYEGITGAINLNYKNPENTTKLYADVFVNSTGRFEGNIISGKHWEKFGTMFFANGAYVNDRNDRNDDGFLDQPSVKQINLMNRWAVKGSRFESQFIVKGLLEQRDAGQLNFSNEDKGTTRNYGIGVNTKRIESIAKTGIFLNESKTNSIAVIASGFFHKQDGFYGLKTYVGQQGNFYANVMYQGIINNTNHNIVTGMSLMYDQYDETINGQLLQRQFIIPGAFGEYTYNYLDKFSLVAGLRLDIPHQYKVQLNPRLHLKYAPGKGATFRVSAGRGFRIPNVYAENSFVFASSRHWMIEENPTYEVAWNSGISYMQTFKIAQRTSSFQVDYFRTQFMKNVIVDIDNRSNMAMVYNIGKGSYSNSLLLEWNVSPLEGLDIKVAYKWEDVKLLQKEGLLRKSMLSPQRGLLVIGYKTKDDKWMFNTQWSLHGKHRLPISFDGNLQQFSPVYAIGGLQVTRYQKAFEFFVGVENLLNTRQSNPITGASDPFGANFDTYQVWGPVVGVIGFGGIRAKI
jgi:hypothetical protein